MNFLSWLFKNKKRNNDVAFKTRTEFPLKEEIRNKFLLLKSKDKLNNRETILKLNKFFEYLDNLMILAKNLAWHERELRSWDYETIQKKLNDVQQDFVLATEAFHEQVYKCLSAFASALASLAPNSKKSVPTRSVKSFLEFMDNNLFDKENLIEIKRLLKSRSYRSEISTHAPNSHWHWETISTPTSKCFLLYRLPGGNLIMDQTDLSNGKSIEDEKPLLMTIEEFREKLKSGDVSKKEHGLRIMTPMTAKDWFVVPHYVDVVEALKVLVNKGLDRFEQIIYPD